MESPENASEKEILKKTSKERKKKTVVNKLVYNYLQDPFKTGAFCTRLIIPYDAILGLWEFLSKKAKEKHRRLKIMKPLYDTGYFEISTQIGSPDFLDKTLDDMLNFLIDLGKVCPKPISRWAEYGDSIIAPEYFTPSEEEEEGYFFFAPQTFFADIQDAISVTIDPRAFPDFIADIASLTPKALSEFKTFVNAIPFSKSKADFISEGKRHSKRFVFDLYPAVAGLWISEFAQRDMNREHVDLLVAALEYMDKREWRMSVILSAFSVESMLIDIYEEILRKEAPPAPIGFLIDKINEVRKFPLEATKPLKIVNRMRKVAVHRGLASFAKREAIETLVGAVQFGLWYCFNGIDFCDIQKKVKTP
jgi:hypothetical protein